MSPPRQPVDAGRAPPGLLSRLTFHWVAPLIHRGRKRALEADDLPEFSASLAQGSSEYGPMFLEAFEQDESLCCGIRGGLSRTLRTLARLFGRQYMNAAWPKPVWLASALGQIYCVRAIVTAIERVGTGELGGEQRWKYLALCPVLFTFAVLMSITQHSVFYNCTVASSRAKSAVVSALFRKSLKLPPSGSKGIGALHTVDVQRLVDSSVYFHFIWIGVLEIMVTSGLLIWELGPSALFGVGIMVIAIPTQVFFAQRIAKFRTRVVEKSDERVSRVGELLRGIQTVKLLCLEEMWAGRVQELRAEEMHVMQKVTFMKTLNAVLVFTLPVYVTLTTFAAYVFVFGNDLDPTTATAAAGLFVVLSRSLSMFPYGLGALSEVWPSLRRFDAYFAQTDLSSCQADAQSEIRVSPRDSDSDSTTTDPSETARVVLNQASFSWMNEAQDPLFEKGSDIANPCLDHISLELGTSEMVACIGPVGSGKTSLLLAIAGELRRIDGSSATRGRIAFCAQDPWIVNATLRANVLLFGQQGDAVDEDRYLRALWASCLIPDLSQLPAGDYTEIGERGVTLSGGQKARVALARAIYADADVYLLDDPLSAVDAGVAKRLRERLFGPEGVLRDKASIVVTHQLHLLPLADNVVLMENGAISNHGTFQDLCSRGVAITGVVENPEEDDTGNNTENSQDDDSLDALKSLLSRKRQLNGATTESESRRVGKVDKESYLWYLSLAGGVAFVLAVATLFAVAQGARSGADAWLGVWATDAIENRTDRFYVLVCTGLAVSALLLSASRSYLYAMGTTRSSRRIFASDADGVDIMLPSFAHDFLQIVVSALGSLILIAIILPWFLLPLALVAATFLGLQRLYLLSSRELKRIDSLSRSPVYSHFVESVAGCISIRAARAEQDFCRHLDGLVDSTVHSFITFQCSGRWLGTRLDLLSGVVVFAASLFAIVLAESVNPGLAGVALTQSLTLTGVLQWATRQGAECENLFTSVERIRELATETPQERAQTKRDTIPPGWPHAGVIEFKDVVLKYRPTLEPALSGLSFTTGHHEKLGICGRTGAGKSSVVAALFRLVEIHAGQVLIDGVDVAGIGLHDLRKEISIVTQDPFVFSGTIRSNLDPYGSLSDAALTDVLARVQLLGRGRQISLDTTVEAGATNLSGGERQLVTLARAIASKARIVVLDEATSSVDGATDEQIQETIRRELKDCTVITIAHRLDTIVECDRIMVLDEGRCVQLGTPAELLAQEGPFATLVAETGPRSTGLRARIRARVTESGP